MRTFHKHLPLLILCSLTLVACGAQKTSGPGNTESKPVKQSQRQQIQQMEPQFLYLAAQNALKDGNRTLAAEFLTALVSKDTQAIEPHIQLAELLLQLGRAGDGLAAQRRGA